MNQKPSHPPPMTVVEDGLQYGCFQALVPMTVGRDKIQPGQWIVEGHGRYRVMDHEAFVASYGKQAMDQGLVLYSVGFGTADDPRNRAPQAPSVGAVPTLGKGPKQV